MARYQTPEFGLRIVVGVQKGKFVVGEPLFERADPITLKGGGKPPVGRMLLVDVKPNSGRVLAEVGDPANPRDVVRALMLERGCDLEFPPEVEEAAARVAREAAADPGPRRDLRELPTFTVDPASARDFDDAVSAERDGDGVRLWIHIADVSYHVKPGDVIEKTAYERATSTYAPGIVEPMLPKALSNDACSLVPGEDRLAVTAEIELGADGEARNATFYRSLIRSGERLTYEQLDEIFAERTRPPEHVAEPLRLAREAAAARRARRPDSALEVSSAEPEFEFDSDGMVVSARAVPQTESHSLIEQLMVLTNEQVALLLEQRKVPTLYRIHEQPDPSRVRQMVDQLHALDLPTPPLPDEFSPSEAGDLAGEASRLVAAEARRRGHGAQAYTSLVLRAMKPAVYSPENVGHAGLGSPAYAHFTSPIRRFPDLIAHRALLSSVGGGEHEPRPQAVADAAEHCSVREREATQIERDADDICAGFLLQRELEQRGRETVFEGEVRGLIGAGAFVAFGGELGEVYEGFVPARLLHGERFDLNESETALVGGRSKRELRFGDPLQLTVSSVDAVRGRVDLLPVGEFAAPEGQSGGGGSSGRGGKGQGSGSGRRGRGQSKSSGAGDGRSKGKGQGKAQGLKSEGQGKKSGKSSGKGKGKGKGKNKGMPDRARGKGSGGKGDKGKGSGGKGKGSRGQGSGRKGSGGKGSQGGGSRRQRGSGAGRSSRGKGSGGGKGGNG